MIKFKGHFDGKVIVPDEPVKIPAGQTYTVSLLEIEESRPGAPISKKTKKDALAEIQAMACNLGPEDLSVNFRKYFGKVLDCDGE